MTFLLSEDDALKKLLKGITVTDQKANSSQETVRSVDVRFGQPDQEISDQKYPYIVIDMIDISEDVARAQRGIVKPVYMDDPTVMVQAVQGVQGTQGTQGVQAVQQVNYDSELHDWNIHWPIPVNIDYQITTYSRQPRHDREILAQILYNKIPMRFAVLEPDDGNSEGIGTVRRLDLLDISKRDVTEAGKRLFVNVFTVRVSSEIAQLKYNQAYQALQVNVTGPEDSGSQVIGRGDWTPIEYTNTQP